MLNLNPTNNYDPSLNVLVRDLGVVTKGRGPLIPLVLSMGGVLANKDGWAIGLNSVNPGGGETGDLARYGTEGTAGVFVEAEWQSIEPLRLGRGGISSLGPKCRPC